MERKASQGFQISFRLYCGRQCLGIRVCSTKNIKNTEAVDLSRRRSDTNKLALLLQIAFATNVLQKKKKNHFNLDWKYMLEDPTNENEPINFIKPRYTLVS